MKKLSILLIFVMLFSVFAFTACGSSDKADTKTSEEKTETQELETEEPKEEETKIDSPLVGTCYYEGYNVKETYVFNDDGTGHRTFIMGDNKVENDFTYEIQDNKYTITYEEGDKQVDEFSVDGDKLHTKSESDDEFDYVRK